MSDYTFLTVEELPNYIRAHEELASRVDPDALTDVAEIGDGNLNLVFLAKDSQGRGVCLKQALPYVRMTGEGWPMTPERAMKEHGSLTAHSALEPDLVPEVFHFNPERYIIGMTDLSDHKVWRGALNDGDRHEGAAAKVGKYVGALAFGTSIFGLTRDELAEATAKAVNPELCVITDDLVFTEPVVDAGRNSVLPGNEPDAAALAADSAMMRAMGHAKWLFMTKAEALVHGDLHTGSVMVKGATDGSAQVESVKAFDSEFAVYGPIGLDLGMLFANYFFAASRAYSLGDIERGDWCVAQVSESWDAFVAEFTRRWPERLDPRVWGDEFLANLIDEWSFDSWLFCTCELARRTVGAAKVADIETLPEETRVGAVRRNLKLARRVAAEAYGPDTSIDRLCELGRSELS